MAARYGAAGGLSTTATEYARFLIEVVDPKPSDAFRLTRTSRDEMIRPQVKVDDTSSWRARQQFPVATRELAFLARTRRGVRSDLTL